MSVGGMKITEICITNWWEAHGQNAAGTIPGETYFDHFVGFASGGFPFPVANGFRRGLGQHWMSTFNVDGLDAAIGTRPARQLLPLPRAPDCAPGRVSRGGPIHEFARRALGVRMHRVQEQHGGKDNHSDRALS